MASRAYKAGEYFSRPVVAKLSSEQSKDNSADISRKDLDDHEPVVDESTRESRPTRKDVEEGLPREKSKKSKGKRKASFASVSATKRPKKWPWTSEAVEILLKYIKEFKTKSAWTSRPIYLQCIQKYADAWRWIFLEDFCPEIVQEPGKELQDMNSEDYFVCPPFWLFCT